MEQTGRHPMHQWLDRFVGDWVFACEEAPGVGLEAPAQEWTETVRSVGGLWIVGEGRGEGPGVGPSSMHIVLGYDPARERFVGTWFGSMMSHLWVYEGALDASGTTLTLDTVGPKMTPDGAMPPGTPLVRYQDIFTFEDDDTRVLRAQVLGDDGVWQHFATTRYRRVA